MHAALKLGWCLFLSFTLCAVASGAGPRHYVFFNRDRERISELTFLETQALEGAQLKYTWRELERGKDGYDFTVIQHDLAFLDSKGKKLFIQLQDASFDPTKVNVPQYLLDDARYHGGAARQYHIKGDDEEHATPEGWVVRRWDPAVQERFHKLLLALGQEFDGKIEGINLAVQDGNYQSRNPKSGQPVTISELVGFATEYLKVDYIFWCTEEPFYSRKLIPFLQPKPRE